jgi:2-formylbenzoate dehydrogenase
MIHPDHENAADRAAGRSWGMLVGGEIVQARTGATYAGVDPTTGAALPAVPDGDEFDVELAYEAASAAAPGWAAISPVERGRLVRRIGAVLAEHADELAILDALDLGSPLAAMRLDVLRATESLESFGGWGLNLTGEVIPASTEHLHFTQRRPYGVVARILPFNHPIMFAGSKIAAPLVAGNTVILKPAHQTPLSALRMGELLADVLPPGVLNIVTGGAVPGAALARHPGIARIAFIGSEATGRAIQRAAAEVAVKHVSLELGGKNAMIVLPDADLDAAAESAVQGMNLTASTGQSCGSTSRLLVHRSCADELVDAVVAGFAALRCGDPFDPATDVGPLVSEQQYRKVHELLTSARGEGATFATGGGRPAGLDAGWFVEPTVLTGVSPRMRVANEEIFGPVLSVLTVDDAEQALMLANAVDYGLTGAVWTRDLSSAHRLAARLDAGFVWVNGSSRHFPGVPYGGWKASGIGSEESLDELLSFTRLKAVTVFNALA